MATPQVREVISLFRDIANPDDRVREKAENRLADIRPQEGFVPTLMSIASSPEGDDLTRKSAVCCLHEDVKSFYRSTAQADSIHPEDKKFFKNNIIEAIARGFKVETVGDTYREILKKVVEWDYPQNWSNLPQLVHDKLRGCTKVEELFGSLCALQSLVELRLKLDRSCWVQNF